MPRMVEFQREVKAVNSQHATRNTRTVQEKSSRKYLFFVVCGWIFSRQPSYAERNQSDVLAFDTIV